MGKTINMGCTIIRKAMAFAFTAFVCAALVAASTFAWGYVTTVLNEWFGTSDHHTATLQKYERGLDGIATTNPIAGARFQLFHLEGESGETTRTQIGGIYLTNDEGVIEVEGLTSGRYVFVEVQPAFGYGFDIDPTTQEAITHYYFTLPSTTKPHAEVVVYNQKLEAPLKVTKTVRNQNGATPTPAQREKEFSYRFELDPAHSTTPIDPDYIYVIDIFDITAPDNPLISSQEIKSGDTFTLRHGHQAHIRDIPAGAFYIIHEIPELGYAVTSTNSQGIQTTEGSEVLFTNTRQSDTLGSLTINKRNTGTDSDDDDEFTFELTLDTSEVPHFTPSSLTFTRQNSATNLTSIETTATHHIPPSTYTTTFTIKAHESIIFEDLPIYLKYQLREIETQGYASNGYEVTGTIIKPLGEVVDITNHKGDLPDTDWEIDITKTLIDISEDGSANLDEPFEFTITVSEDGITPGYSEGTIIYTVTCANSVTVTGSIPKDTGQVMLTIRAGDRITITGQDARDIHYRIVEKDCSDEGYFASPQCRSGIVRRGQQLDFLWENTYRPPLFHLPAILRITKQVEGEQQNALHPFEFELIIEGDEPRYFTLVAGETKSFDTVIGAQYSVRELLNPQDGYVLVGVINGQGTVTPDLVVEGVTFTNRYTRPITIDIEGEKIWDLRGADVSVPGNIEVYLIDERFGTIIARQTITAADGWLFIFAGIDKYDADGIEIPYTVSEAPLKQYAPSVTRNSEGYFTILNTHIAPAIATTPLVSKQVIPASAPDTKFNFILEALDGAPLPLGNAGSVRIVSINGAGTSQLGTITFTEAGTYRYLIRELAQSVAGFTYDLSSYELIYTVTLEEVDGDPRLVPTATLTHTTTGAETNIASFTNTYVKPKDPEEPKEPDPKEPDTDPRDPSSIGKTGDDAMWMPWLTLCLIAVGTVVFAIQVRRRST